MMNAAGLRLEVEPDMGLLQMSDESNLTPRPVAGYLRMKHTPEVGCVVSGSILHPCQVP
jgi:hypothetical protein